ncbi:MAG: magnesium transporter [Alphaproteobacteria bacterium]
MTADALRAADALNRRFFVDHPLDAARKIEELKPEDVAEAAARQPVKIQVPVWRRLLPETAARLLLLLPREMSGQVLAELPPAEAVRILGHLGPEEQRRQMDGLEKAVRTDLETLLAWPPETAGRLMNTRVRTSRPETPVGVALQQMREKGMKTARSLFLTDDAHRLTGRADLADLALAAAETPLSELRQPVPVTVRPTDPLADVTEAFETHRILDLPVVDLDGVFLGAVTHDDLAQTIHQDATLDIQTMVGASKEERALSGPLFTVRKRMPWLQVNLLTAFLAAAVVGLFESTIARVTALAVLLPVVAGQSGNAGAQALAVTMRGLALREITVRQWSRVMRKEVSAGLLNGIAVASTCGIGVYIWSGSPGLVAVICASMILAMVTAGFAGALIPIVLTRLGQDPATASSIVLTTVTDVAGFFSFLGIATLLMQWLV